MKYTKQLFFITLFLSIAILSEAETVEKKVFAPFVSQLTVEKRGSGILLSWKDSPILENPRYHIYQSKNSFDSLHFIYKDKIATVNKGRESYLYKPGDPDPRYFLILAEEEGKIFDVFIPYRNMSMEAVGAEETVVQEELAARISALTVYPEDRNLLIKAETSDPSRPHILFRSSKKLINRDDLLNATIARIFVNEKLKLKDPVVPGIPYYYAIVDKELFESKSESLLYHGSVSLEPVSIALEDWVADEAHSFTQASRHVPLPLLNFNLDIEGGKRLPEPGVPPTSIDLSSKTELALARINFGKSVHTKLWKQPQLLTLDASNDPPEETAWVKDLMQQGEWTLILERCEALLNSSYNSETNSRLFFYKGQAHYFSGNLEYAFMDFLSSRTRYYSQSNSWLTSIYEQKRQMSKSRDWE